MAAFIATAAPAQAADFNVACGDVAGLRAAITSANATAAVADTITIGPASPCVFTLTNSVASFAGPNGLPVVTSPLTINGNGATIQRQNLASLDLRLIIASGTDLKLNNLVLSAGKLSAANQNGGAVGGLNSNIEINDSVLAFNVVNQNGSGGGAVALGNGSLKITDTSMFTNFAWFGGAIYTVNAPVDMRRSSLSGNGGTLYGGAAVLQGASSVFENVTVDRNATGAASTVDWGGVAVIPNGGALGRLDVSYSTFTDNGKTGTTAPGGQLIAWAANGPAEIRMRNNVIADRDGAGAQPACVTFAQGGVPSIVDQGGNIEHPTTSCPGASHGDPKLDAPVFEAGELTVTFRPLPGSSVIDAATGACPATDQREVARPDGGACDVGAYETPQPETVADADSPTNDPQVTFSSPDTAGASFECQTDGVGGYQACTLPHEPAGLADGDHFTEVRAVNGQGYRDLTPAKAEYTVDTTAPAVSVDPVTSPTADSTPDVSFTVGADPSGIGTVTCEVDNTGPVPCSSAFATPALTDGEHTVTVRATDNAGNTGSDSTTFVVDASAPNTTITSGPTGIFEPGKTNDSTPSFEFISSEMNSTFECRVDGGAWVACPSPYTTASLPDGQHTFEVRAIDALDNVDPTPASSTFTVIPKCSLIQLGNTLLGGPFRICLFPVRAAATGARAVKPRIASYGLRLVRGGKSYLLIKRAVTGKVRVSRRRRVNPGIYTVRARAYDRRGRQFLGRTTVLIDRASARRLTRR